jgi:hypothetical protein
MFTYTWKNSEQTALVKSYTDPETNNVIETVFPVSTENNDYVEYLESGLAAASYVAPVIVDPGPTELELLTARVSAIESNEISDDSVDTALLTLIANLTTRVTTLEEGS